MIQIIEKFHSIKINNFFYVDVTDDVQLNKKNNEWDQYMMKLSASKICNISNRTKITFNLINCCYLDVTNDGQLIWCNNE